MEYIAGGPILRKEEGPLDEETTRRYFCDLINGLEYLHEQKIIHRDIKPENLLVSDSGVLKITDFGVSHVFVGDDDTLSRSAGSPAFLAPELCTPGANASGKAVDIWACGITLYYLLVGQVPFMAENVIEIYDAIRDEELVIPDTVGDLPRDLLLKLLQKDPRKRITIHEIKEHLWIEALYRKRSQSRISSELVSDETSTINPDDAIANSFVTLIKLKNRMKQISKHAKTKFGKSESDCSDLEDKDPVSDASEFRSRFEESSMDSEDLFQNTTQDDTLESVVVLNGDSR